jgi:hypothetical protein
MNVAIPTVDAVDKRRTLVANYDGAGEIILRRCHLFERECVQLSVSVCMCVCECVCIYECKCVYVCM